MKEGFTPDKDFMEHYVAEILRDDIYYPDGQIREEVYEYGSFLQSKMYAKGVTCSNCHNPHNLKLKGIGNNLCGQCHSPAKYDSKTHHFHNVTTESSQCVNCHMPGRTYLGRDGDLMYAISILYIQQHAYAKAQPYVETLASLFPESQPINQLKQLLQQNL